MINTIAPCGMNCLLCHSFQDAKSKCPGCGSKNGITRKNCSNCVIRNCDKKVAYCFECEIFPCKQLKNLDKRYRLRYGMSMIENLEYIRSKGEEAFVASQNEKYKCPECNKPRTVHDDYCIYCKQEKGKSEDMPQ